MLCCRAGEICCSLCTEGRQLYLRYLEPVVGSSFPARGEGAAGTGLSLLASSNSFASHLTLG